MALPQPDDITSPSSAASRKPIAPAAPATQPGRQSRLWNAGRPAGLAALEARHAAERQAHLHDAPWEAAADRPDRAWDTPENVIYPRLDD
jgi:hypothetical protein